MRPAGSAAPASDATVHLDVSPVPVRPRAPGPGPAFECTVQRWIRKTGPSVKSLKSHIFSSWHMEIYTPTVNTGIWIC